MRDSGGHGGSSFPEINVPLIFLGPKCFQQEETYNQIDIPATLSVLFGLPIPASSIGNIIPNLLTDLSMEQKLFAYYYNGERLLNKLIQLNGIHFVEAEGNIRNVQNFSINHSIFLPLIFRILCSVYASKKCT